MQPTIKYIIVTDRPQSLAPQEDRLIISPSDFIRGTHGLNKKSKYSAYPKVINLCSNFDYLGKGYYISLLAEARSMACAPHISDIVTLNWKRNYEFALSELNALLKKHFKEPPKEPLQQTHTVYFGRTENPKLDLIARHLFDLFRFPVLSLNIKYSDEAEQWIAERIESESFSSLSGQRLDHLQEALDKFTGQAWRSISKNKKPERYWIAILHNPKETHPPSNKTALNKFIKIGKQMGLWVELITKQDFSTLLEFDALFIRETTAINNHTYRFAAKAQQEDIPCIDDTKSIIRCCNKVFLHELLGAHKVPMPQTLVLDRHINPEHLEHVTYPAVLKIPDGSFSHGIYKVENINDLMETASKLLKKSEIVLCQEFVESEFDWRIGVLGGKALYASQYFMAENHWQIYNHAAKSKRKREGAHKTLPLNKVPQKILSTAIKAANLVGNGLYGVDLKQTKDGHVIVIEVNDNPSIDHGVEDQIAGDDLYRQILQHFVQLIEE